MTQESCSAHRSRDYRQATFLWELLRFSGENLDIGVKVINKIQEDGIVVFTFYDWSPGRSSKSLLCQTFSVGLGEEHIFFSINRIQKARFRLPATLALDQMTTRKRVELLLAGFWFDFVPHGFSPASVIHLQSSKKSLNDARQVEIGPRSFGTH
jgi:hypothetical protein